MNAKSFFRYLECVCNDKPLAKLHQGLSSAGIIPKFYTELNSFDIACCIYALGCIRTSNHISASNLALTIFADKENNKAIIELQKLIDNKGDGIDYVIIFQNGFCIFEMKDKSKSFQEFGYQNAWPDIVGFPLFLDTDFFTKLSNL